jgi:hypothetical protein
MYPCGDTGVYTYTTCIVVNLGDSVRKSVYVLEGIPAEIRACDTSF